MLIFATMLGLGLFIGFVGGGGSGFVLAILISVFGIPVHTALGTSTSAMAFTVLSGAISHFREGNTVLRAGVAVGLSGAVGALFGTIVAGMLPPATIVWLSASMLFVSSMLLWLRMRLTGKRQHQVAATWRDMGASFWYKSVGIGLFTGFCSGCFGIGSTPLIQLGMLIWLGMTLHEVAATSTMVIIPVAFFAGIGFLHAGFVDWPLLLKIVAGTVVGSYVGAKFTKRVPVPLLRSVLIALPVLAGALLLVK